MPQQTPARHSAYYPPRAGGRLFGRRLCGQLYTSILLDRLRLPASTTIGRTFLALLVPGLSFYYLGPRLVARIIWLSLPWLVLTFLAGLGTPIGEFAFALVIGAHVASVSHLIRPLMSRHAVWQQMMLGLLLFLAVSLVVYLPIRNQFHAHIAMPLAVGGGTIIVNPRASAAEVQVGDVVAYRIHAMQRQAVIVREGFGVRPVWGLPGDRVQFGDGFCSVNGVLHPLDASSAAGGTMIVPEDCWFIWPDLSKVNPGVAPDEVQAMVHQLSVVPRADFVGRRYAWWFFRPQATL